MWFRYHGRISFTVMMRHLYAKRRYEVEKYVAMSSRAWCVLSVSLRKQDTTLHYKLHCFLRVYQFVYVLYISKQVPQTLSTNCYHIICLIYHICIIILRTLQRLQQQHDLRKRGPSVDGEVILIQMCMVCGQYTNGWERWLRIH